MPNRENIERSFELAASQWGLFTSAQALAEGASRTQLSRLVAKGRIEPICYGVYRLADGGETPHAPIKAAWLSLFPKESAYERLRTRPYDAVVSGRTAACMHGDTEFHASPYTFAVADGKRSGRSDVELHAWHVDDCDITAIEGLPVTSVERTIADLIRSNEDPSQVGNYISNACKRGHIIDETRLAELLSPLAKRNAFANGDGKSFAHKLVSDYADAPQMQLASDAFRRALKASTSLQTMTDQMNEVIRKASKASQITYQLDFSKLPAITAMTQIQEALEPYRQLSRNAAEALEKYSLIINTTSLPETSNLTKVLQHFATTFPPDDTVQANIDGDTFDEVQDSEGT